MKDLVGKKCFPSAVLEFSASQNQGTVKKRVVYWCGMAQCTRHRGRREEQTIGRFAMTQHSTL